MCVCVCVCMYMFLCIYVCTCCYVYMYMSPASSAAAAAAPNLHSYPGIMICKDFFFYNVLIGAVWTGEPAFRGGDCGGCVCVCVCVCVPHAWVDL